MTGVQIFGIKSSQATRAAQRFFKERRVAVHMVDLNERPLARGESNRFIERFGLAALLDTAGKAYVEAGLAYMILSEAAMLERIGREPSLLRLPLVRGARILSVGHDEEAWKAMSAVKQP